MKLVILSLIALPCFGFCQPGNVLDFVYAGGGRHKFYFDIGQVKYPQKGDLGVVILNWKVKNGVIIDPQLISGLGKTTNAEILDALDRTQDNWIKKDSLYEFFLPLKFRTKSQDYFVDPYPPHYLREIVFLSYSKKRFEEDNLLVQKMNEDIRFGNFRNAVKALDKLILRNPLNKQLRESRIFCNLQPGLNELACADIEFVHERLDSNSKYECKALSN